MRVRLFLTQVFILSALAASRPLAAGDAPPILIKPTVVMPLDRFAYFNGETIPLSFRGIEGDVKLEAQNADGRSLLYSGPAVPLFLENVRLAPGAYDLLLNGASTGQCLYLCNTLRRSSASLQDESEPPELKLSADDRKNPGLLAEKVKAHGGELNRLFAESGVTGCVAMGKSEMGRSPFLDAMARSGAILLVNPDTRPTSFYPAGNEPGELDGMSQRMILTAQANGRYPNFGGFCFGWDTTAHAVNSRLGLLVYWDWGDKTQALRTYIKRIDQYKMDEFTRRTGLKAVSQAEYIAYLASIGMPGFAPVIDLPAKRWVEEISHHIKPLGDAERRAFEQRLDAWSSYLMGLYAESYSAFSKNLRETDSALRHTSSVQADHSAVINGQYFPSAYEPLDLCYQAAWNDQVGGPDYLDQGVFIAGLLNMQRNGRPTWVSNAFCSVHGLSDTPGKFVRLAAQNLAYGGAGIGFALEGFSNVLGGLNKDSNWDAIKDTSGGADVVAGREFLERFSTLAVEGRGDHGVGILFSKSQFERQYQVLGFGVPAYRAFIALMRLGYTPAFVTEEELAAGRTGSIKALVLIGQTVPLPEASAAGLAAFQKSGGRIIADGSTTIAIQGAETLKIAFPDSLPGKPHNWNSPNLAAGENDTILYARIHPEAASAFYEMLRDTGGALLRSERGARAEISLLQIDGGADAKYIVAVNDSFVANQADWHRVREMLHPSSRLADSSVLYDCTDESALGNTKAIPCDLTKTVARTIAILTRDPTVIDLRATQTVVAGGNATVSVTFRDTKLQPLSALIPFHLALRRPDGKPCLELYRATNRDGTFSIELPIPANAPIGEWTLALRSQLNGRTVILPIAVAAGKPLAATPLRELVVVRQSGAIAAMLEAAKKTGPILIPVFDSPRSADIRAAAEKAKAVLAGRGIDVEIRAAPALANYTPAYDLTDAQKKENASIERGESIGRIKRETVNGNDWYSGMSAYRLHRPVVLFDLSGVTGVNPMAEALGASGLLWPQVSESFPGPGRAVMQGVHWAFAPRTTAVVIQAADAAGLMAGADALANLPEDRLTPGITEVKAELWRQFYVGGKPSNPEAKGLGAEHAVLGYDPQAFQMHFPGAMPPERASPFVAQSIPAADIPAVFEPKQYIVKLREGNGAGIRYIDSATADALIPDLRFSDAIQLNADTKEAGRYTLRAEGVFRYSDRTPCRQACWEDIINLRESVVPKERRPMEWDVWVNGKPAGKLAVTKTAEKEVPLELYSATAGMNPKSQMEEVAVELSGAVELPAGSVEIMLIHQNVVDGKLNRVAVER